MRRACAMALLGIAAFTAVAPAFPQPPQDLDALLQKTRDARASDARGLDERVQRFRDERDIRATEMREAQQRRDAAVARSESLLAEFDENEVALTERQTQLDARSGNLGEVFGVVRQVSGISHRSRRTQSSRSNTRRGRHGSISWQPPTRYLLPRRWSNSGWTCCRRSSRPARCRASPLRWSMPVAPSPTPRWSGSGRSPPRRATVSWCVNPPPKPLPHCRRNRRAACVNVPPRLPQRRPVRCSALTLTLRAARCSGCWCRRPASPSASNRAGGWAR